MKYSEYLAKHREDFLKSDLGKTAESKRRSRELAATLNVPCPETSPVPSDMILASDNHGEDKRCHCMDGNEDRILEEYIRHDTAYGIFVFNNKVVMVRIETSQPASDAERKTTSSYRSYPEWKPVNIDGNASTDNDVQADKPACMDEMETYARRISWSFDVPIRVDFFIKDERPILNALCAIPQITDTDELTDEADDWLGSFLTKRRRSAQYDKQYESGGWAYDHEQHTRWLKEHIVDNFDLRQGTTILEIGCGMGIHSMLLDRLGMDVLGVDVSFAGIEHAKRQNTGAAYLCCDLNIFDSPEQFDVLFCRGMSWFHYELDRHSPMTNVNVAEKMPRLFKLIKPGGLFILQIKTDFSGTRNGNDVHDNTFDDYVGLFEPHGEIILVSNWQGEKLTSREQAKEAKGNVLIATRKPTADR